MNRRLLLLYGILIIAALAIIATLLVYSGQWSVVILSACLGIYLLWSTSQNKKQIRLNVLKVCGAVLTFSACAAWTSENLNASEKTQSIFWTITIVVGLLSLFCLGIIFVTCLFAND